MPKFLAAAGKKSPGKKSQGKTGSTLRITGFKTGPNVMRAPGRGRIQLNELVGWLREEFPDLAHVVADVESMEAAEQTQKVEILGQMAEFSEGGRGAHWASTIDEHLEVRKRGTGGLLDSIPNRPSNGQDFVLLDVFGGAGFISQFASNVVDFSGTIITSDASELMVRLALQKGLPVMWQKAQDLFMTRENSVDAVVFAYGTHHVAQEERDQCFREAYRVLKPGGSLLVHDFEEKSTTVRWFSDVVDRYTNTGHKHAHFTARGMEAHFKQADFVDVKVDELDDSFCLRGPTREDAISESVRFMASAYGLEKLPDPDESKSWLWEQINDIFGIQELSNGDADGGHAVLIRRTALLGVGRKAS